MLFLGKAAGPTVLYVANRCVVHQLYRTIVVVLQRLDLIVNLYALSPMFLISPLGEMNVSALCTHCAPFGQPPPSRAARIGCPASCELAASGFTAHV